MDTTITFTLGFLIGFACARPLQILAYALWMIHKHRGLDAANAEIARALSPKERP